MTTNTILLDIWRNRFAASECWGNTHIQIMFMMACSYAQVREDLGKHLLKLIKISRGAHPDAELQFPDDWKEAYSRWGEFSSNEDLWDDYVVRNYARWRLECIKKGFGEPRVVPTARQKRIQEWQQSLEFALEHGIVSLSDLPSADCDGADTTKSFELDCDAG